MGKVQTTHAEALSYRHAATSPPTPAKIKAMLPKLADLPKEAETKAKTDGESHAEIRELKASIHREKKTQQNKTVSMIVQQASKLITENDLNEVLMPIAVAHNEVVQERVETLRKSITDASTKLSKSHSSSKTGKTDCAAAQKLNGSKIPSGEFKKETPRVAVPVVPPFDGIQHPAWNKMAKSNLGLVRADPRGARLLEPQRHEGRPMASHAGPRKFGTSSTYKSALRSAGFIEERSDGLFYATQAESITSETRSSRRRQPPKKS